MAVKNVPTRLCDACGRRKPERVEVKWGDLGILEVDLCQKCIPTKTLADLRQLGKWRPARVVTDRFHKTPIEDLLGEGES